VLLAKLTNAYLAYGVHHLLDNAEFQINDNERICIIGRNGTGKTSLLNILAGKASVDSGNVWYRSGLRMAYLTQDISEHPDADVYGVVASGLPETGHCIQKARQSKLTLASGSLVQAIRPEAKFIGICGVPRSNCGAPNLLLGSPCQ